MQSMTGFGRAEVSSKLGKLTLEIAAVNNRFLEFNVRTPRQFMALESQIREYLSEQVSRGKLNVTVSVEEPDDETGRYIINKQAVRAYVKQLKSLQKELKLSGTVTLADLVLLPEVTRPDREEIDLEAVWKVIKRALKTAVSNLKSMRAREGKAMKADMQKRLRGMARLTNTIEKKTSGAVELYAERLKERVEELMQGPIRDEVRLEEEIAIFADRTDISEEIVRLRTHIEEFQKTIQATKAVGRRLNFILQEMNREINTIGSKSSDFGISSTVISLKEEIEKLREMVQNVE